VNVRNRFPADVAPVLLGLDLDAPLGESEGDWTVGPARQSPDRQLRPPPQVGRGRDRADETDADGYWLLDEQRQQAGQKPDRYAQSRYPAGLLREEGARSTSEILPTADDRHFDVIARGLHRCSIAMAASDGQDMHVHGAAGRLGQG